MNGSGRQPIDNGVTTGAPTLFDPDAGNTAVLQAAGATNAGPSAVTGKVDGATGAGQIRTPLADALPKYTKRASDAARSNSLTPSERSLVRAYFEQLQGSATNQPAAPVKQQAAATAGQPATAKQEEQTS